MSKSTGPMDFTDTPASREFASIVRRWRAGVHVSDDDLQIIIEFYRDFCSALEALGIAYRQTLMLASSEYQQALKVAQTRKRHREAQYANVKTAERDTTGSIPAVCEVSCG